MVSGIIIAILILLLIFVTVYYTSQEYYTGTILQATSGYDAYNLYHYFFDIQYSVKNKSIGGKTLKTKRIEVSAETYQSFKVSDKILIKA